MFRSNASQLKKHLVTYRVAKKVTQSTNHHIDANVYGETDFTIMFLEFLKIKITL